MCTGAIGQAALITSDLKDHGDQDNRCLFWHCYRVNTLYFLTKSFLKPVADGDMRGWH